MTATHVTSRVVVPGEIQIPISGGDFVRLKRKLNAGESIELFERSAAPRQSPDEPARLDPIRGGVAMVVAYLVDWSLVDPEGAPIPIRGEPPDVVEAALRSIDIDSFTEIVNAVQQHDRAVRQEKKRTPPVVNESPEPLPLPVGAGGVTSG